MHRALEAVQQEREQNMNRLLGPNKLNYLYLLTCLDLTSDS